jgi:hypothetical protein
MLKKTVEHLFYMVYFLLIICIGENVEVLAIEGDLPGSGAVLRIQDPVLLLYRGSGIGFLRTM